MKLDTVKLGDARIRAGLLIRELSQRAGISEVSAQKACRTGQAGIKVARSLAGALGLRLADIIEDTGTQTAEVA